MVIFVVDGLNADVVQQLIAERRLPHISRHFQDGGAWVERAIACFPSVTYPNVISLLTGRLPGNHGVPSNRWLNRASLQMFDYRHPESYRLVNEHFAGPTVYERLPDHFTVNVQCHTRRGVSHTIDHWLTASMLWAQRRYEYVDARVGSTLRRVARVSNRRNRWPSVLTMYFPGVDEVGHRFGPNHPRYRAAIENVDHEIGYVIDTLRGTGLSDRTWYVLVSDHGLTACVVDRSDELRNELTKRGWRIREDAIQGEGLSRRAVLYDSADAILVMVSGRFIGLCVRGVDGWRSPPDPDRLARLSADLLEIDPDALLFSRASGGVQVNSSRGVILIHREKSADGANCYRLTDASSHLLQRLGYSELAGRAGDCLTSAEWLTFTADSAFPDLPPQVYELFESPRTPDLVVSPGPGSCFDGGAPGGHGGATGDDLRTVLAFSGPGIDSGTRIPTARLVDVVPTLLQFLRLEERLKEQAVDGKSLFSGQRFTAKHEP